MISSDWLFKSRTGATACMSIMQELALQPVKRIQAASAPWRDDRTAYARMVAVGGDVNVPEAASKEDENLAIITAFNTEFRLRVARSAVG